MRNKTRRIAVRKRHRPLNRDRGLPIHPKKGRHTGNLENKRTIKLDIESDKYFKHDALDSEI